MKRQTFNHVGKSDVERSKDAQTSISTDAQGLKVSFKIHLKTFQKMPSMLNRFRKKVTKLTNHYSATLCCVHVTLAALGCLFVGTERMRVRVCVSACVREIRSAHVLAVAISSPVCVLPVVPVTCLLQCLFIIVLFLPLSFSSLVLLCIAIRCSAWYALVR